MAASHPIIEGAKVELLYETRHFLGEGALWTGPSRGALSNKLLYIDIYGPSKLAPGPAVFVADPYAAGGPTIETYPLPSPVGTVVPDASGDSLVVALKDGFHRVDLKTKAVTRIAQPDAAHHPPAVRFNDGKCSPDGRFFCGTMKDGGPHVCPGGPGSLYRLDPADNRVTHLFDGVTIANGLAWSLDGKTLYWIDTPYDCVYAFDYSPSDGSISNKRTAFAIPGAAEGAGHPDGMCIDHSGRLWIAQWGGYRVVCYEPSTGAIVTEVRVPGAAHVSSCCFAGVGGDDLIITTAQEHLTAEDLVAQPNAGNTFIVRGVGATGAPGFAFGQTA